MAGDQTPWALPADAPFSRVVQSVDTRPIRPSDEEILGAIAVTFGVSRATAVEWVMGLEVVRAAQL